MTNIVLFLKIPTFFKHNLLCDEDSAHNLESFLDDEIKDAFTPFTKNINIKGIGNVVFLFTFLCVKADHMNDRIDVYINAKANINFDDKEELYNIINADYDNHISNSIIEALVPAITETNKNLHIEVPFDEYFIFSTDNYFYVRIDPLYGVHTPEFRHFYLETILDSDFIEDIDIY